MTKKEIKKLKSRNVNLVVIGLLFVTPNLFSQQKVNMQDAIAIGIANNPEVKIGQLKVEQTNYLNKLSLTHQNLNASFGYGQINAPINDYQLNFSQQFYFPSVYSVQKNVNDAKTQVALAEQNITIAKLSCDIRSTYLHLAYLTWSIRQYQDLAGQFESFTEIAKTRYELGDATLLEYSAAQTKQFEVQQLLMGQQNQREIYLSAFNFLLHSANLDIESDSIIHLTLNNFDTGQLNNNATLLFYQSLITQTEKEISLAKSSYLPEISIGYTNQQIEGVKGLSSYSIGIQIPLFANQQHARIESAKINNLILQESLSYEEEKIRNEITRLMYLYMMTSQQIIACENSSLSLSELLVQNAISSYREGEISYVEYLNALEQSTSIKQRYFETINLRNQIIITIHFLIGLN